MDKINSRQFLIEANDIDDFVLSMSFIVLSDESAAIIKHATKRNISVCGLTVFEAHV